MRGGSVMCNVQACHINGWSVACAAAEQDADFG